MTVADLLRGLLLASANDAAATLAARVGGSNRAFVALMNRRARELGLTHTHYANAIGLDALGNYSSAEDLVKLTLILRRNAFFRAVTDLPRATLRTRRRTRGRSSTATCSCGRCPRSTASRPATRSTAGYILVGSASQERRHGHLGRPRRAQRGGARPGLAGAHPLRPGPLPPRQAGAQGRGVRDGQARPPRRARAARGGAHRRAHRAARGEAAGPRARRARASSTGRCPRDRGWGRSRSAGAGARSRACRS